MMLKGLFGLHIGCLTIAFVGVPCAGIAMGGGTVLLAISREWLDTCYGIAYILVGAMTIPACLMLYMGTFTGRKVWLLPSIALALLHILTVIAMGMIMGACYYPITMVFSVPTLLLVASRYAELRKASEADKADEAHTADEANKVSEAGKADEAAATEKRLEAGATEKRLEAEGIKI